MITSTIIKCAIVLEKLYESDFELTMIQLVKEQGISKTTYHKFKKFPQVRALIRVLESERKNRLKKQIREMRGNGERKPRF